MVQHSDTPRKVAIIGSGNWGCAIAKIIAKNCQRLAHLDSTVNMWVYEEVLEDGRKLTDVMNETHENVKYLPGYTLPTNLIAEANIEKAVSGANILVFVIPHQFIGGLCEKIMPNVSSDCIGVSLIKGLDFDENGLVLISELISKKLGGMDISVLMGANIASEVAAGCFCESTVGYSNKNNGLLLKDVFDDTLFRVGLVDNVRGVEICGALKNVVALGAGFSDGMHLGENCKAAVLRIGFEEMRRFIQDRYPEVTDATFFASCGIADLITTAYGGRNHRVAEAYVLAEGTKTLDQLEDEILKGQKLQGTLTCKEIHIILERDGHVKDFPLFASIYRIAFEGYNPETMISSIGNFNLDEENFSLPAPPGAPTGEKTAPRRLNWKVPGGQAPTTEPLHVYMH
eukprot:CAMPEP_0173393466 /NCGR_PEP_ID=MMETSP1356-20130122/22123_1 /TAXON_ID=77927 ORGANISM="Hemiselmis virescens, Strain PCC157" /NCGR_SAMPLE_ID=MMETSP1356 /ASSEMBLY_ACC=CAM_ASM_000847 /LENGTH=399 /DNA_ID=CAMNT_0014351485 /DNA_START=66 /DNA_END=1265 /DNA_ORIENTATION=+